MNDGAVVAGLDIGTQTVRVLLGEYDPQGRLLISGWGESPSEGLRRGSIVNIEAVRAAVEKAVEAAEHEAGRTITELWTSLGGGSVDSQNSRGVSPVSGRNREVGKADIDRVLEMARAIVIPMDREILHALPHEYIIDDQEGVKNPLGMIGVRMEAWVHVVTASLSAMSNLRKTVERAGGRVREIAQSALVAARAVLDEDEKEMGALLIDIGADSTDYMLVQRGSPRLSGSVPVGGNHVTSDLSIVLKIPMEAADRLKLQYGSCWSSGEGTEPVAVIPGSETGEPVPVSEKDINRIIQPRMEELFEILRRKIESVPGMAQAAGKIVLCGGGALLPGAEELAAQVFERSARIGSPRNVIDWPECCRNPRWCVAAGLVLYGNAFLGPLQKKREVQEDAGEPFLKLVFKSILNWLGKFF